MGNYSGRSRLVLLAVVILALASGASSQQKTTSTSGSSIAIQAVSKSVKAGVPVWVEVKETNNSDKIQIFFRRIPMDQGGNIYTTDVWDNKGERCTESAFYRKFQGHLTVDERLEAMTIDKVTMSDTSGLLVKPGDAVKYLMDVGRLYVLNNPGAYTIQVQLPVQSNKITVTVVP